MLVEWTLKYKDKWTNGNWHTCSYSDPTGLVDEDYLKKFWGVDECEEYELTKKVIIDKNGTIKEN